MQCPEHRVAQNQSMLGLKNIHEKKKCMQAAVKQQQSQQQSELTVTVHANTV